METEEHRREQKIQEPAKGEESNKTDKVDFQFSLLRENRKLRYIRHHLTLNTRTETSPMIQVTVSYEPTKNRERKFVSTYAAGNGNL